MANDDFQGIDAAAKRVNMDEILERGLELMRSSKFKEAVEVFRKAVSLRPDNVLANTNLGKALIAMGDPQGAIEALDAAIQNTPEEPALWLELAEVNELCGNFRKAREFYKYITSIEPKIVHPWLMLARLTYVFGDIMAAGDIYKYVLTLDKMNKEARDFVTRIRRPPSHNIIDYLIKSFMPIRKRTLAGFKGLAKSSVSITTQPVEIKPRDTEGWTDLATRYHVNGNVHDAIHAAYQAILMYPGNFIAWFIVGEATERIHNYTASIDAYTMYLEHAPPDAEITLKIATLHEKLEDHEAACKVMKKYLDKRNKDVDMAKRYAEVLLRANQAENAIKVIDNILNSYADAEAWFIDAKIQIELGDNNAAIDALTKATNLDGNHVDAWVLLGGVLSDLGEIDAAIAACRKAITLKDENPDAWYNLANALASKEKRGDAIQALRKATSIKPDHADAWYNLGVLLEETGDLVGSAAAFKKSKELEK
nr:tetratricopeptide repeat protein [Candidatus Sigynarchaeum springense]